MLEPKMQGCGRPMLNRLSEKSTQIIMFAEQEMLRTGHSAISPLHLLRGFLAHADNSPASLFTDSGIALDALRDATDAVLGTALGRPPKEIRLDDDSQTLLRAAEDIASRSNSSFVQPEHLFLALIEANDEAVVECLRTLGKEPKDYADLARSAIDDLPDDQASVTAEHSGFDQAKAAAYAEKARLDVDEAFARRRAKNPDRRNEWKLAVDKFHRALAAAYPPGFDQSYVLLKRGHPEGLEVAIVFLEDDPWFFRSGYIKAELIRFIVRLPLTEDQAQRLRRVVLRVIESRDRREFRAFCRLARKIDNDELRIAVSARVESPDPDVRRRAKWVLQALVGQ